ncbi:Mut7-C RNAse domain-containing protein [Nitratifractor sp.]
MKRTIAAGFIADVQLGRLARHLRFGGYDTLYFDEQSFESLRQLSRSSGRILLSRNRRIAESDDLLVFHIRSAQLEEQLLELAGSLPLREAFRPFTRCMLCNTALEKVGKEDLSGRVPGKVLWREEIFFHCPDCDRIYWRGDHYRRMMERWKRVFDTVKERS